MCACWIWLVKDLQTWCPRHREQFSKINWAINKWISISAAHKLIPGHNVREEHDAKLNKFHGCMWFIILHSLLSHVVYLKASLNATIWICLHPLSRQCIPGTDHLLFKRKQLPYISPLNFAPLTLKWWPLGFAISIWGKSFWLPLLCRKTIPNDSPF